MFLLEIKNRTNEIQLGSLDCIKAFFLEFLGVIQKLGEMLEEGWGKICANFGFCLRKLYDFATKEEEVFKYRKFCVT